MVTTEAMRRAKLQSNRHHQQTNTQFFRGRMPVAQPIVSKQTKKIISTLRSGLSGDNPLATVPITWQVLTT